MTSPPDPQPWLPGNPSSTGNPEVEKKLDELEKLMHQQNLDFDVAQQSLEAQKKMKMAEEKAEEEFHKLPLEERANAAKNTIGTAGRTQESTQNPPREQLPPLSSLFGSTSQNRPESPRYESHDSKAPLRFKDAVGRKFSFPFHLCATWSVSCYSSLMLSHSNIDR
jgi:hypothetical protein